MSMVALPATTEQVRATRFTIAALTASAVARAPHRAQDTTVATRTHHSATHLAPLQATQQIRRAKNGDRMQVCSGTSLRMEGLLTIPHSNLPFPRARVQKKSQSSPRSPLPSRLCYSASPARHHPCPAEVRRAENANATHSAGGAKWEKKNGRAKAKPV